MKIAVDFDGTIVENEFPGIGPINQDVREFIVQKKKEGHIIILWTTRDNEKLQEAVNFCDEHGIPVDLVNENVGWLDFETSDKIFADVYVDDRGLNPFDDNLDGKVNLTSSDSELRKTRLYDIMMGKADE